MKKIQWIKAAAMGLALSIAMCGTALAAADDEDLTMVSVTELADDGLVGSVSGHGTIEPDPTLVKTDDYTPTFSNNTKISLKFYLRSFGISTDSYKISIYKGDTVSGANLVCRTTGNFNAEVGGYESSYAWDTTDTSKYEAGTYTIVAVSYYFDSALNEDAVNDSETATVVLEDYRLVQDREFVSRLYDKFFGRAADAAGLKDWSEKLYNGTETGAEVVYGFANSTEQANKDSTDEEYIELLYEAIFDREADEEGMANWLEVLGEGVSRNYILKQFTDSAEFTNLCSDYEITQGTITLTENRDQNILVTGFVNRLYTVALDRTADADGLNDWTGRLLQKKATPQAVASGFVFSQEMTNRDLTNEQFVTMLYQTMMDREPDEGGYADWVGKLDKKTQDRGQVYEGFAASAEFAKIVKSYGL